MDFGYASKGEDFNSLPESFVKFINCLGMPVVGLREMESRNGHGVRVSRGKKRSSSRSEREIQKLECSVNYNSSPFIAKGKRSGAEV